MPSVKIAHDLPFPRCCLTVGPGSLSVDFGHQACHGSSCLDLLRYFMWISRLWVVTRDGAQWYPPQKKYGFREGGPKRKMKRRFFNPPLPHPWCEKCHMNMESYLWPRECEFRISVVNAHVIQSQIKEVCLKTAWHARPQTRTQDVYPELQNFVLEKFCTVLLKILLSLRDSTHLILEQTQVNVWEGA